MNFPTSKGIRYLLLGGSIFPQFLPGPWSLVPVQSLGSKPYVEEAIVLKRYGMFCNFSTTIVRLKFSKD